MDLPQIKNNGARTLLRSEYDKFMDKIEKLTENKITVDTLKKAIGIVNAKRKAVHHLSNLRANIPAPISGLDSLLINQIFFYDDSIRFTGQIMSLCDKLELHVKIKAGVASQETPRILISGCLMAIPNWKLPAIIETSGAVIVGEESCMVAHGIMDYWLFLVRR